MHQHTGLAAAGTGKYQHVARLRGNCFALGCIQVIQDMRYICYSRCIRREI